MKRRPMFFVWVAEIAAWLIVFIIDKSGSLFFDFTAFVILSILIALIAVLFIIRTAVPRYLISVPVLFIAFLIRFTYYQMDINYQTNNSEQIIELISKEAYGRIDKVEYKNDNTYIYIQKATDKSERKLGGILILISGESNLEPGESIRFYGKAEILPLPTNPGQFNSEEYYKAKGITFRCIDPYIEELEKNKLPEHVLFSIKRCLKWSIELTAGEDKGVYEAMLLGEKGELSDDTKNLYQSAGISHILAISGLHVTFIGMLIFKLLKSLRLGFAPASIASGVLVVLYSLMTGSAVSAIRAAVMLILSLGAIVLGRTYDMISALILSWCVTCFIYPGQLLQAGFQLSFGAIIAFAFILPEISFLLDLLRKRKKRGKLGLLKRSLYSTVNGFFSSIAVAAVTWPVIAWHMYVLSPLSIFINLIVVPLMSIIMANILVAAVAGLFCICGLPVSFVRMLWLPSHYILKLYAWICDNCGKLSFGQVVTGRPTLAQLLVYCAILIAFVIALHYVNLHLERKKDMLEISGKKWYDYHIRLRRTVYLLSFPFLTGLQLLSLVLLSRPSMKNTLVMLDVGQGDGILYFDGDVCAAIDGGNSFMTGIGTYRIEPAITYYGYDMVNAWFITHPDKDHVSGLLDILTDKTSSIDIGALYVPEAAYDSGWEKIKAAAGAVPIYTLKTNDRLRIGESKMDILFPDDSEKGDSNELCFVMRLETKGKSVLFCGDIDLEVEEKLVKQYGDKLSTDILKVAHHGSKYASQTEFLKCVSPNIALISVGKNNYGHPSPETISRLENVNADIYTTIQNGYIKLDLSNK